MHTICKTHGIADLCCRGCLDAALLQVCELKDICEQLQGRACDCGGSGKCAACKLLDKADAIGVIEKRDQAPQILAPDGSVPPPDGIRLGSGGLYTYNPVTVTDKGVMQIPAADNCYCFPIRLKDRYDHAEGCPMRRNEPNL